jgi:flagellum-specific peptidoglycan hydrolase FlgJ
MLNNKKTFLDTISVQAIKDMREFGILASLKLAQAILESNWGKSGLSVRSNNLFGIKGKGTLGGDIYATKEYDGKKYITINAEFRKYRNWSESVADHTKLLLRPRYARLKGVTDYKLACKIIKDCGYATDHRYTEKLITVIEANKLYEFDKIALNRK